VEGKEQYQVKMSNRVATLLSLDDSQGIDRALENTIRGY
jgi:hypothetical protein